VTPTPVAAPSPVPSAAETVQGSKSKVVRTFSGVNVGKIMKSGSVTGEETRDDSEAAAEVLPETRDQFTQNDLERVWEPMAKKVAATQPNLYNTLTCRPPVLTDEFKVVVTVDNKIQEGEIFHRRGEMLSILRESLNNWGIQIETLIADRPPESRKPYTDQEKFDNLAGQNPVIKKLKDQLNLDIDM